MKILIATGNAHKAVEIGRMLDPVFKAAGHAPEWLSLADFPEVVAPEEIGEAFEDIALLKARNGYEVTGLLCLGDDSGLAVDALDGGPGVRSRRFSGPDATDADNNALLLKTLRDTPDDARGAAFVSAIAIVGPGGAERVVSGRCEGEILREGRGSGGFGYDPLFFLPQLGKTMAELRPEEKDAISHRGAAVRALLALLARDGADFGLRPETS